MQTYFITVEGIVSRVERIQAPNLSEAMQEAKKEFTAKTGALSAAVTEANKI